MAILLGYLIGALVCLGITSCAKRGEWETHEHVMVAGFWFISLLIVVLKALGRLKR